MKGRAMPTINQDLERAVGNLTWAEFSPGALARMTGFSQALQRVWRRRGQIRAVDGGRASFSAPDAAALFVRHQLSLWAVSPDATEKIGAKAGRTALYFALLNVDGACEVYGAPNEVAQFIEEFEQDDLIARNLAKNSETARYLWRGDAGVFVFEADIQRIFDRERSISICCIDLAALGTRLGNLAERPLIRVSLECLPSTPIARRLTTLRGDDFG